MYPLTRGQNIIMYAEKWCADKSCMNIAIGVHFEFEIDRDIMLQAIYMAFLRAESAAIRLTKIDKEMKMYLSSAAPEPVEILDYSDKSEEELNELIDGFSSTPFPNNRLDVQLYKVRLIKKPDGRYVLFVCIHHSIMDAYALMYVASDILKIYKLLLQNGVIPPSKSNIKKLLEMDGAEAADTARHDAQLKYWEENVYTPEPQYVSVNGAKSKMGDIIPGSHVGRTIKLFQNKGFHINKRIPKRIVDMAREFARENHISEKVIYLLAIRSHICRENNYADDMLLFDAVARRATVTEKYSGMTRVDNDVCRMNFPNSLSFEDAAKELSDTLSRHYKNVNISLTDMIALSQQMYGVKDMTGYSCMNLTFQGYGVDAPEDTPIRLQRYNTGVTQQNLYLTIMAVDNSGDYLCNYEYACALISPQSIEAMHLHMQHFIERAVSDPQMSLDELMRIEPLYLNI